MFLLNIFNPYIYILAIIIVLLAMTAYPPPTSSGITRLEFRPHH